MERFTDATHKRLIAVRTAEAAHSPNHVVIREMEHSERQRFRIVGEPAQTAREAE